MSHVPTNRIASNLSRRTLLQGSAALAATSALAKPARAAAGGAARPVLIQVFLRGGMDGLTTVVPYGDPALYTLRPRIAIQPPGAPNGALDLNGFFGLAPSAAPLLTPYNDGRLVIVHATGSTDPTRSHFDAFARMEYGDPSLPYGVNSSGWAARYLQATASGATTALRGIGVSTILPYSLREAPNTLPIANLADFDLAGLPVSRPQRLDTLANAYARRRPAVADPALETMGQFGLGGTDFDHYTPENGAQYPDTGLGARFRNCATLIKADFGVEVFSIDYFGWDLHLGLGPIHGTMAGLLDNLTRSLEAFYIDMLGHLDDYVLVVLSEFGRHVRQNGSDGVDHGHGNAMLVMGNVNGGRVIADWPGLSPSDLDQGDLAITIDYRDILGEVLQERFGITDLAPIFPGHAFTSYGVTS
jgi:uncharacterized protein (DUF1501 family)